MERAFIKSKILALLCKFHDGIDMSEDYCNLPLTGNDIQLDGVLMTYLFFEIEKEFSVRFEENHIIEYRFNTINSIVMAVKEILDAPD